MSRVDRAKIGDKTSLRRSETSFVVLTWCILCDRVHVFSLRPGLPTIVVFAVDTQIIMSVSVIRNCCV